MNFPGLGILIILLLIIANGVFAMSELALVSVRKSRLQHMAEEGDGRAKTALELAESPNLFLSTVSVGITLIGVLNGAFGGANLATPLASILKPLPYIGPYSDSISLTLVVVLITFLSLVIGELVPKRFALNDPERISLLVSRPMHRLSQIALPAVRFLGYCSDLVLKLFRTSAVAGSPVTEDEIRLLISQGTVAGVFEESEQEMLDRIFRLGDRSVGAVMTLRKKMDWLDVSDSPERVKKKVLKSRFTRFPVCQGRLGNVLGIVHVKDLLDRILTGNPLDLRAILKPPLFVHEALHVLRVMELLRESGHDMALVIDEYGTIEGLVTPKDVLESIVGDISDRDLGQDEMAVQERDDGSWLIDGMLPVDELKALLDIRKMPGETSAKYQTVGGFVMSYLSKIPRTGEKFSCCGFSFEVVDMDGHRVDKLIVARDAPVGE